MTKILKLAIVVLVIYFVLTNYESWVENISNLGQDLSRKGDSVSQGLCVRAAEEASEAFARGMRDYAQPPIDLEAWDDFLERVKERVYQADSRCDCPRNSCLRASEALAELSQLIEVFDGSLRGNRTPVDVARRQETIDRMLRRARELDRQGD